MPPPSHRQEAKGGLQRRKSNRTLSAASTGDHFIEVKAKFGEVFTHAEYTGFQEKFRECVRPATRHHHSITQCTPPLAPLPRRRCFPAHPPSLTRWSPCKQVRPPPFDAHPEL